MSWKDWLILGLLFDLAFTVEVIRRGVDRALIAPRIVACVCFAMAGLTGVLAIAEWWRS